MQTGLRKERLRAPLAGQKNVLTLQMVVPLMLTFLTINANGLHDETKWQQFWQEIPHVDVICI